MDDRADQERSISQIPLQTAVVGDSEATFDTSDARELPGLEPVDGGPAAWRVLITAFVFEAVFWGFVTSFGIFQAYYSSHPKFASAKHDIPVIGTLAQGLVLLGAPFSTMLAKAFPRHQRHLIVVGWILCILGLLCASFATTVPGLIATQGMLYGMGFVILIFPILSLVGEWWNVRKGMAFGTLASASGLTGAFMPLTINALLHRYSYQTTLRACAVVMFLITAPLLPLLKGRLPSSEVSNQPPMDLSFIKKPLFWVYSAAVVTQGLGLYFPSVFIPTYAENIGLPSMQAALLLTAMSVAQTLGQSGFGWLSDRKIHVSILSGFCCIATTLATALLWGLGKSLWSLVLYSIIYGFFAYGFNALRVAMGRAVSPAQSNTLGTYSSFIFLQGVGAVLVGPIAAGLMSGTIDVSRYGASLYEGVVIFVAASSSIGGMFSIAPYMRKAWRRL